MHIMSSLDDVESALLIIGVVFLRYKDPFFRCMGFTLHDIAKCLALNPEDVEVTLGDLASVIEIDTGNIYGPAIRVLHASLGDFLFDMARSRQFYVNPQLTHAKFANQCLQDLKAEDDSTFEYAYKALYFHLNQALPTSDLRRSILDLSLDDMLQHLVNAPFARFDTFKLFNSLPRWITSFLESIKMLGFEDSDDIYAHHLASYERLIMMELDKYGWKAPTKFLLSTVCIVCSTAEFPSSPWMSAQIDYHAESQLHLYDIARQDPEHLIAFLGDSMKSGRYAMGDDKYAVAALWCLVVLGHPSQQFPARYTNHDLEMRQNSPWRWRKLATCGFFKKRRQVALKTWKSWDNVIILVRPGRPFAKFHRQWENHRRHSRQVYSFILKFLPAILDRSGKLDLLVKLARRRSFADTSLKYPRRTKRAKEAMERYVARVAG
ncbi:hypothetical protein BDZ97DRAFT_1434125 [Flammula alnicola]|nr:hypothetical protein BDZ97DRAFT_1434125 [Flammula alnicola]